MSKHTPWPWEETYGKKIYANGRVVAEVMTHEREHEDEDSANASLIAAAPDMLAALEHVIHVIEKSGEWWIDDTRRGGFDAEMIRAAIAKATGEKL